MLYVFITSPPSSYRFKDKRCLSTTMNFTESRPSNHTAVPSVLTAEQYMGVACAENNMAVRMIPSIRIKSSIINSFANIAKFSYFCRDNQFVNTMKVLKLLVIAALSLALASCSTTAEKIRAIVDDSVENADQLTTDEWAERDRQIEELLKSYENNPEALSEEDRESIDRALGRYYGAQMKQGIDVAKRNVEDFMNRLPSFIEGFMDAFDSSDSDTTAVE